MVGGCFLREKERQGEDGTYISIYIWAPGAFSLGICLTVCLPAGQALACPGLEDQEGGERGLGKGENRENCLLPSCMLHARGVVITPLSLWHAYLKIILIILITSLRQTLKISSRHTYSPPQEEHPSLSGSVHFCQKLLHFHFHAQEGGLWRQALHTRKAAKTSPLYYRTQACLHPTKGAQRQQQRLRAAGFSLHALPKNHLPLPLWQRILLPTRNAHLPKHGGTTPYMPLPPLLREGGALLSAKRNRQMPSGARAAHRK